MAVRRSPGRKGAQAPRPLDGIKVLDLSRLLPGGMTTLMLANFGAEVIKVEDTESGDYLRDTAPLVHGMGAVFRLINRGKKSVSINLKHAKGRAAFLDLVKRADVVVDGFRPGVMKKLKLDYDALRAVNKRIVYVAITGYGQSGPNAKMAGHDLNYMSFGGALDLIGNAGAPPAIPAIQFADIAGGAWPAVIGALLALRARDRTGEGQLVDVSMLDGVVGMLPVALGQYTVTRQKPRRGAGRLSGRYACYHIYRARDGQWLSVAALEPKFWAELCKAIEHPELIHDQFAEDDRQRILIAELTRSFARRKAEEWMELFKGKDVCVSVVRDIAEVAHDEHLAARGTVVPLKHPEGGTLDHLGVIPKLLGTPGVLGGEPPRLGEHTRDILGQAGIGPRTLDELLKAKAIRQAEPPAVAAKPVGVQAPRK